MTSLEGAASTVAFTEFERKSVEKALAAFIERRRPPAEIRSKLDLGFRVKGQSVEIFEIRPDWNDPSSTHESPVARATFVTARNRWKVFWNRADLKWHGYSPAPEVRSLEDFLALVERDEHACFFG